MRSILTTLLLTFCFINSAMAKDYIREAFIDLNTSKSLLTPIEQGKIALVDNLVEELWSFNSRQISLEQNETNSHFFLTDIQKTNLVKISEIIMLERLGTIFYLKAKISVEEKTLQNTFIKNNSEIQTISKEIKYLGNNYDSKVETFRRAINGARMEVLSELGIIVNSDTSITHNGLSQKLSDIIETYTQGLIRVKHFDSIQWSFNTVSFNVTFEVLKKGVLERWKNNDDSLSRSFDNFSYSKQTIKENKFTLASPYFHQGIESLESRIVLRHNIASFSEPIKYFSKDANDNMDVESMAMLCFINSYYFIEVFNIAKPDFSWCQKASVNGSALAQVLLVHYLISVKGITDDRETGLYWLKNGTANFDASNTEIMKKRGDKHYVSLGGKRKSSLVDFAILKLMNKVYYQLGQMHEQGIGVIKNMPMAINYYKQCSVGKKGNEGNEQCMLRLGDIYQQGIEGTNIDLEQALYWYGSSYTALGDFKETQMLLQNRHPNFYHLTDLEREKRVEHFIKNDFSSFHMKKPKDKDEATAFYIEHFLDGEKLTDEQLGRATLCARKIKHPACLWRIGQYYRNAGANEKAIGYFQQVNDLGSILAYRDYALLISDNLKAKTGIVTSKQITLLMKMLRSLTLAGDQEMRNLRQYWINIYEQQDSYINLRKAKNMVEFIPYK
jgi:TPR repeat protein